MTTDNTKLNERSYDAVALRWDDYRRTKDIDPLVVEFIGSLPKNAKVLDVGCGSGYPIDKYLSDKGFFVVGVDISSRMIDLACKADIKNATFIKADIAEYAPTEKFDAIIAFDSLFHIEKSRLLEVFSKLAKALKSGGKMTFTFGKNEGETTGKMFGQEFYYASLNLQTTLKLLEDNGLIVKKCVTDHSDEVSGTRELVVVAVKK